MADQEIDGINELYLAGSNVKLNPPLQPGNSILDFQMLPDGSGVVYHELVSTIDRRETSIYGKSLSCGLQLQAPASSSTLQ